MNHDDSWIRKISLIWQSNLTQKNIIYLDIMAIDQRSSKRSTMSWKKWKCEIFIWIGCITLACLGGLDGETINTDLLKIVGSTNFYFTLMGHIAYGKSYSYKEVYDT